MHPRHPPKGVQVPAQLCQLRPSPGRAAAGRQEVVAPFLALVLHPLAGRAPVAVLPPLRAHPRPSHRPVRSEAASAARGIHEEPPPAVRHPVFQRPWVRLRAGGQSLKQRQQLLGYLHPEANPYVSRRLRPRGEGRDGRGPSIAPARPLPRLQHPQDAQLALGDGSQLAHGLHQSTHAPALRRRPAGRTRVGLALEQAVVCGPEAWHLRAGREAFTGGADARLPGERRAARGHLEAKRGREGLQLTATVLSRALASPNAHCTNRPWKPWWHTSVKECAMAGSLPKGMDDCASDVPVGGAPDSRATKASRSASSAPATMAQ
eukprot:scaffold531_cov92-Isochrysis_galbana.AAC.4